ncbi:MAG: hypothetical protein JJU36_13610 [Phycisphaeraceae bacterium]|nr:hypothetical protein [Phycisphaeraceae bacterium]
MFTRQWLSGMLILAIAGCGLFGAFTPSLANNGAGLFANEERPEGEGEIKPGAFGKISVQARDLEIGKVLQMLAMQSQRNIVASRNVAGTVTVNLTDVDFHQALDATLRPNGLGYEEREDIIFVYTQDELARIKEQSRRMVSRVVRLQYLRASDAVTLLGSQKSQGGTIVPLADPVQNLEPSLANVGGETFANTNLLVINDFPENMEKMLGLLKEVDVRPRQVLIEAAIMSVTLNEENKFGVDFTVLADFRTFEGASPLNKMSSLLTGSAVPSATVGRGQGTQSSMTPSGTDFRVGFSDNNINVVLSTLAEVNDTTVLAKPKVLVLNRQRAKLEVLRREGYITRKTTEFAETETVEFLDVGTELTVRPFATEDGFIRLEIFPKISDGVVEERGDSLVPRETTQNILTNVMVRSGQTVILGGLFEEKTITGRNQVPFLGDIPILGSAFRGQADQVQRNEYIFMIRASLVRDERLGDGSAAYLDRFEQLRIGAREGLLPWSRDKLAAAHLQRAISYQRSGNDNRALMATRWALASDPRFLPARELRDQLTGSRRFHVDYEGLQEAVDMFIDTEIGQIKPRNDENAVNDQTSGKAVPIEPIADAAKATDQADAINPETEAVAEEKKSSPRTHTAGTESATKADEAKVTSEEAASEEARTVEQPVDERESVTDAGETSDKSAEAAGESSAAADEAEPIADESAEAAPDASVAAEESAESTPDSSTAAEESADDDTIAEASDEESDTPKDDAQASEERSDDDPLAGEWGVLWDDEE